MNRIATIVPGSSSWWLVTLSPLIFYDKLRVCSSDIKEIFQDGSLSSLHERFATVLEALLKSTQNSIIIRDTKLPASGRSPSLEKEAKQMANEIITYSGVYTRSKPTVISPAMLKRAMRVAYTVWIEYNTQKLYSLHKSESFSNVLRKYQIPESRNNLRRIIHTPPDRFPDLLEKDSNLRKVFEELVRNAILITDLANEQRSRAYDILIDEFIPTIELVERIKVFCELSEKVQEPQDIMFLSNFYDFRINKVKQSKLESRKAGSSIGAVKLALKGRRQFSVLRKQLAELDVLTQERTQHTERIYKEISSKVSAINKTLSRIDKVGAWGMWFSAASSAYFFTELIAASSPEFNLLVKSIIFNPYTTKKVKNALQNLLLAKAGLKPNWNGRISIIRDYATPKITAYQGALYKNTPIKEFKFWV